MVNHYIGRCSVNTKVYTDAIEGKTHDFQHEVNA